MVDPARRTRTQAFDQARLAQALGTATGGQVDPARLPFATFDLSRDGRTVTLAAANRRWTCDITAYTCVAADSAAAAALHAGAAGVGDLAERAGRLHPRPQPLGAGPERRARTGN
jgi:hypothetical protein